MHPLLIMLMTAGLSSLMTLGLAYLLYRLKLERALRERIDGEMERARLRFRDEVARAGEELGSEIESRVERGIKRGIASIASSEVLRDTTRAAARTGAELLGDSLRTLLGGSAKPPPDRS